MTRVLNPLLWTSCLAACLAFGFAPLANAQEGEGDEANASTEAEVEAAEGEGEDHEGEENADAEHAGDAHAGGHHDLGHGNASKSLLDPSELQADLAIYSLLIFLCLMAILAKFAWPQIAAALDAREKAVSDNIAAAAAKHEEAKKLLAEHQAKIDAAAEDVRAMLDEARRDAEATKDQIVADARSAAEAERQRALRDIETAKEGAVRSLAEQSAKLAVDLASKVVKQEISSERQGEIVREALGLMGTGNNN